MTRKRKGTSSRIGVDSLVASFWTWRLPRRWRLRIAYFLAAQQVVIPLVAGYAQSIQANGRTQTTVTTVGKVTDITTSTVKGVNAFNSFSTFNVAQGNTVNLMLPGSTQNLINIVTGQQANVYGILNSIKDGQIGGNVWFADPFGFVVGRSGVVNIGSLTVSTPTPSFANTFFLAPNNPDDASVAQLLSGTAPRGDAGLVSIQGKVNALNGITLSAGTINVGGTLYSGARFLGTAPDFTDVVNANGLASATRVVVNQGRIQIVADDDVAVSGTITAPGGAGVQGGDISIRAGNNVDINAGANLSARGSGADSAGGSIDVWGGNNATFQAGAVIDASAGSSGNGGAIEFSARNLVTLAGGQFRADAPGGRPGSVLIDPADLDWTGSGSDQFTGGLDLAVVASNSITLNDVDLSTRTVETTGNGARSDNETGDSTGASGNLLLQAPTITVTGSKLLAFGTSGYAGGSITLDATATGGGAAGISLAGSTLKGASVTLDAAAAYAGTLLPVVVASPSASIDVESSLVQATAGDVRMTAGSSVSASTLSLSPLATIAADSSASVNVAGTSAITATGNATLAATSTVTASALAGTPNVTTLPADAGVAVNVITSSASTHVGGSTSVSVGGTLELDATNNVTASAIANSAAGGANAAGGTLAMTELNTSTQACLDGTASVVNAGAITLKAESSNALTTSATAATQGATKQPDDGSGNPTSQTEQALQQHQGEAATSGGSVQVAAAVAIADVNSTTQAYLASTAPVTATGALAVSSQALNTSAVTADGSTAGGSVGVGAAVGLNLGVTSNQAWIGDNSAISADGITLGAIAPASATNTFTTTVTSGAGASNVGVAGALGVNVLVDSTAAFLQGDANDAAVGGVDAGGGAVLIQAQNATASTVTSGASLSGTGSSAKVGVGASVGLNVEVATTQAEVQNGAILDGADGMGLNATATHAMTTTVTGGAAGTSTAVTPTAAVSIAVDTTTALLGTGGALDLAGAYTSTASQTASVTTTATGQTQGSDVAVGASLALTTATDTVAASVARDLTTTGTGNGITVAAVSSSSSSASATASVAGGKAANADGSTPTGSQDVDQQVAAQNTAAQDDTGAADADAKTTVAADQKAPPSASTSGSAVSVAAAVGVDVAVATTSATLTGNTTVASAGPLTVSSTAQTGGTAKADGSQTDNGGTNVGVGAAVALNLAVASSSATIPAATTVSANGVTVSAMMPAPASVNAFEADATSGAGSGDVGVAGSLALNTVDNSSTASLAGGSTVAAGTGPVLVEAQNLASNTVTSGASVQGSGSSAKVGVGASVGLNVAVDSTTAEVADGAGLTGGTSMGLNATGGDTMTTTVTGGASAAQVAVTPLVAVSVAVDSTTALLGTGAAVDLAGSYSSTASQAAAVTTTATGTTQGSKVAVGASLALTTATDTVTASVERDLATTGAGNGITVAASSTSSSSASATASVAGGAPANSDGSTPSGGQNVDQQVASQGDAAKDDGADASATAAAKGSGAPAPSASSNGSEVTVAAAIGVNVGVSTVTAEIGSRAAVTSAGKLTVASTAQTGAQATADGSQTGDTGVGVGAAVALNAGSAANQAVIDDGSTISAQGVTVSALMPATGTTVNTFGASSTSGAGAQNVGVAGSLALNVVVNTTEAQMDGQTLGTSVDAGGGEVLVQSGNTSTSTVTSGATVTGSGSSAKVGVGASVGVNVVVDSSVAEVGDGVALTGVDDLTITAQSGNTLGTTVTGGASGAQVNITPLASVAVALNTTTASLGTSATGLSLAGKLSTQATGTDTVTTTATGQTSGDVAVGASLAATVAMDHVSASIDRNVDASTGIAVGATSTTSLTTTATASAKGAATNNDSSGNPQPGTTPDEQKDSELNSAEKDNSSTASLDLSKENDSASATTPSTSSDSSGGQQSGAKVSVAAAIGVGVAENQAVASTGTGLSLGTSGNLGVQARTDTNYATTATGEAVSDKVGIAAAVALTATLNETQATLGENTTVPQAGSITVSAIATQNLDPAFLAGQASVAISGASGGSVAVAGALAVVGNYNETQADIDDGAQIGSSAAPVGDITVASADTSRLSAAALAGGLSKGSGSEAGVGASFAVLLADNHTSAEVGAGAAAAASAIYADSLAVTADKNPVDLTVPFNIVTDPKNTAFLETLANPATYLSQVNDYTEAVAGAASQGNAAVAGSFSVNVFGNTTSATLNHTAVTTTGTVAGGTLGVQVASHADTDAIAVAGGVAIAKQAGVGISNTDIVNSDQVLATIDGGSTVTSTHSVQVDAEARQNIVNVAISGGAGTSSTGVGGVLGVVVTMNTVEASIGDGTVANPDDTVVKSGGDVAVTAGNDTLSVMAAGGIGAGSSAGVGASIAANIVKNATLASIGLGVEVDAVQALTVGASAAETAVTGVVAGAGAGDVGVAGALSLDTILADTEASVGQGARLNVDPAYAGTGAQTVAITAQDGTVVVGVAGGLAGGGDVGVGAALDTTVLDKTVKAFIADDPSGTDAAVVNAAQQVAVGASSTDSVVSVTLGLAGGGDVGVGGAVSIAVVENTVQATIGQSAVVSSGGNVLVNAQDGITAVLTAGGAAGGGDAGVGGSLAVATLLGTTEATIGSGAQVTALGNGAGAQVYAGDGTATELASGLAVTANTQDSLVTTVASGAGGGSAGVAATVSANVIASTTEAEIDGGAVINADQTGANASQQVRVNAIDDTSLVNTAAGAGGGGAAGIGAAANVGVIAKTTIAEIGAGAQVNAVDAVELGANAKEITVSTTAGFAGGGSAGVGGAAGAIAVADTTEAIIADGTSTATGAKVAVSAGDLDLDASDQAISTLVTGSGAGGGAAGVGVSLAVSVNTSTTEAKLGNYAETSAAGATSVQASSWDDLNALTVAGAGGGAAGVAGTIAVEVVASTTEAGIGRNAQVNQSGPANADQSVSVQANDQIVTVNAGGAGAGGGAAGVGGTAAVTFVKNTTTAYIDNDAQVDAAQDISVQATDQKTVGLATISGAGGGAAGVAGAVSVIAVGSLFDGQASSGLQGNNTGNYADSQTTTGSVGGMLGTSAQSTQTANVLDSQSNKLAVNSQMTDAPAIPHTNTQAYIGFGAQVSAGGDVDVAASDSTLAIVAAGSGAGGGAAGVAGAFGVVLLHDSAEAFIADAAQVNALGQIAVDANTSEQVYNVGITASGGGAAAVNGAIVVNVVSSDTSAYVGDAELNQAAGYQQGSESVAVNAGSTSTLVTAAAAGGGAGAASVGGVLNTNVLTKDTEAFIGQGAQVSAQTNVAVSAASQEDLVNAAVSIEGAGAAGVSGVAAANFVDDTTQAYIGAARGVTPTAGTLVDSQGNVTLSATDATLIVAASAVGNGAGAAAVGGNVGANVIANDTEAFVSDDATVNARGDAAGVAVYDGGLGTAASLPTAPVPPANSGPSTPSQPTYPAAPGGQLDISGSGSSDGNLNQGASIDLTNSNGGTQDTSSGLAGQTPAQASGGLGAMTRTAGARGLSISAVSEEKIIPVTLSVAGAGAAAVTGSASANIVATTTEATLGDNVTINSGTAAANEGVRLTAADSTLLVQTAGTISGAGAAAVSGAANVGIVTKTTLAQIGDATVNAGDLSVQALSTESVYTIGANLSVAGAAGVGGTVGVASIQNRTTADIGAGADIDATGSLTVAATQDSAISIYTFSGAGGIVGVSGALSVGIIDNTTEAYVADSAQSAPTVLNAAGTTRVAAASQEDITTVTISGAGGGVGVAAAVSVKVVEATTQAYIGQNVEVNQTTTGASQDVTVDAADSVTLGGGAGSAALAGIAVGAGADIDVVRNTTSAYLGSDSQVSAGRDVTVQATSTRDVESVVAAASGLGAVGVSGAVAVAVVGADLNSDATGSISSGSSGSTASSADGEISTDQVSGQLGSSSEVSGMKGQISTRTQALNVSGSLNDTTITSPASNLANPSTPAANTTQAFIGSGAVVSAGAALDVAATDHTAVDLTTTGAAEGELGGLGGAVGITIVNDTTQAFIAGSAQASGGTSLTVDAESDSAAGKGYSLVTSAAGSGGGVVGGSAAVATLLDTSTTQAYVGAGAAVTGAASAVTVEAATSHADETITAGFAGGGLAVGGSVAVTTYTGTTDASVLGSVTADSLAITAGDSTTATALATAGTAGILSGAGAGAGATVTSTVDADLGASSSAILTGALALTATGSAGTRTDAYGVSAGAAAVGVSAAVAETTSTVTASVGEDSQVTASAMTLTAQQEVSTLMTDPPAGPGALTNASANSTAATGGLVGLDGSASTAQFTGTVTSSVGAGSNLAVTGAVSLQALDASSQYAFATGAALGLLALGEDIASASSSTTTRATLGNLATVTAGALTLNADGTDTNFAEAISGSGGVISGSAAEALTGDTSTTYAGTGSGDSSHQVTVDDLSITASHTALFNGVVDSVNAGLVGASGAVADHEVSSSVQAEIGAGGVVTASSVTIAATNTVDKDWLLPASYDPATDSEADAALWNVNSGSGGALDAAGGASVTNINLQATTADVGDGAVVVVTVPGSGLDGVFTMNAHNVLTVHDKVDLNSGGAIALAEAASIVNADTTANGSPVITTTASFGENAKVTSTRGDIDAGSWSTVDLNTLADADTYGLAGAPAGQAYSHYAGLDQTQVQTGAELLSANAGFNLAAGQSSSGDTSSVTAISTVNLWNKTAIPIATTPDAQSNIAGNALLDIAGSTDASVIALQAAGDINLTADKGAQNATATGIGKNIYLELAAEVASGISELFGGSAVSFDIQGGTTAVSGQSTVQVDGVAQTGINRNVSFTLDATNITTDANGKVTWTLDTNAVGVAFDPSKDIQFSVSIGQAIYDRIALLRNLSSQYAGTVAAGAYDAEISFLEQKLVDLGLAKIVNGALVLGTGGAAGVSPQAAALALAASLQAQSATLVTPVANAQAAATSADTAAQNASKAYTADKGNLGLYAQRDADIASWNTAIQNKDTTGAATYRQDVINDEAAITSAGLTVTTATTSTSSAPPSDAVTDYNNYNSNVVAPALNLQTSTATTASTADAAYTKLYNQKAAIDTSVANLTTEAATLSNVAPVGATADYVTVPDITVQLGSINVAADVLKGSGELLAPGDAKVLITNNTPDFLNVGNITVDSASARVTLNGVAVNSNADINAKNSGRTGADFLSIVTGTNDPVVPVVDIESTYNPTGTSGLTGPAPDITLTGTISNTQGSVTVNSAAGSINAQGSILGGTVNIKASNGDFVQSYVDGFDNIAGDPETIWDNAQNGTPSVGTGILANGSVLISARYLNINGTIQSGIADYTLTLPTAGAMTVTGSAVQLGVSASAIAAYLASYANQTAAAPVPATTTFTNNANLPVTYNAVTGQLTMTGADAKSDAGTDKGRLRNPSGEYTVVTAANDTITASYDAVNNRYVVDSTQVMGGYIQLYGQIINTASSTANGTGSGELKVLDGYGQIKITNPSNLDLVLATLDTGQGVAGVIDITDIQYVDSSEAAHSIHTVITRDDGAITTTQTGGWVTSNGKTTFSDTVTQTSTSPSTGDASTTTLDSGNSRLATYQPQAGLEYVYTTGFNSSTITDYDYSGTQFFGSSDLRLNGNLANLGSAVAGPYQLTAQQMANGTYLAQNATGAGYYNSTTLTTPTAAPVYTVTSSWTSSNWWDFDITQTYHIDYTKVQALQTITTNYLKADNPIGIDFIGYSTGGVTVNSASNITLTGAINNKTGTTSITAGNSGTGVTAADQNIVQGNGTALISTGNLNLTASGSVGSTTGKAVRVAATGTVNATATDGDVVLKGALSSLDVGTIQAGATSTIDAAHGQVVLDADESITAASAGSILQGEGITLTAEDGTIGTIAAPLAIQVGYSDDSTLRLSEGLKASASSDIGIVSTVWSGNQDADLLINTVVSAGGNVSLSTPGRIIDNNPNQQTDTRAWQALVDYWNTVGLVAGSAQNQAQQNAVVAAYNSNKTQDYDLYWQIRDTQPNPAVYDPGFTYTSSAAEAAALNAAGQNVATFDANRTTQYHTLNAEVGSLTTSYVPTYKYVATEAETAPLLAGSSWTEAELALSVTPGLLKDITDTNPVLKDPNVKGNNVTLTAGVAIGETQTPIEIDVPSNFTVSSLTDTQKEALAAAEASDVVFTTKAVNGVSETEILIYPRKPVNFAAGTGVSAIVTGTPVPGTEDGAGNQDLGNLFLASQGDAILDTISATDQARIKVLGSISNESAASPAVQTGDLVLEAANGGIANTGTSGEAEPVRLDLLPGATLTARAEDDINLVETTGDMNVSTVFSTKDVKLAASQGSITNGFEAFALNVLADTMELSATGGHIGSTGKALDVATNLDGGVTADATGGVTLYSPAGNPFHVAAISSGDAVQLTSAGTLSLEGAVSAVGSIGLVAGAELILAPEAAIHTVATGVTLEAGAITMEAGSTGAASILVDSGSVTATTYGYETESGSTITNVPGTFTMADNGSHAASITASTGTVSITAAGDATVTAIASGSNTADAVTITSTAGHILPGHATGSGDLDVIADAGPDAQVNLDAALGIGDDPLYVRTPNLKATSGGVMEVADQGALNVVGIAAAGQVQVTATGEITGGPVTSGAGADLSSTTAGIHIGTVTGLDVSLDAPGDVDAASITGTGNGSAGIVDVTSTAGSVNVVAATGNAVNLDAPGSVTAGTITAAGTQGLVNLVSASSGITFTSITGNDVNLTARDAIGTGSITSAGASGEVTVTSTSGAIDLVAVTGNDITLSGTAGVTIGTITGGNGSVSITSGAGNVAVTDVTADSITLGASGDVTATTLDVGSTLNLAGTDITAGVNGGSRVVGGAITGFGGGDAADVQLTLSSPSGFDFSKFWSSYATVDVPAGSFGAASTVIADRAIFTNPRTEALVDQFDLSVQSANVQLTSQGLPFSFNMFGDQVDTDAYVVYRDPEHEANAPAGTDRSGAEQTEDALTRSLEEEKPTSQQLPNQARQDIADIPLVSYSGFPVSIDEAEGE